MKKTKFNIGDHVLITYDPEIYRRTGEQEISGVIVEAFYREDPVVYYIDVNGRIYETQAKSLLLIPKSTSLEDLMSDLDNKVLKYEVNQYKKKLWDIVKSIKRAFLSRL